MSQLEAQLVTQRKLTGRILLRVESHTRSDLTTRSRRLTFDISEDVCRRGTCSFHLHDKSADSDVASSSCSELMT